MDAAEIQQKLKKASDEARTLVIGADDDGSINLTVRTILNDLVKADVLPDAGKELLGKILSSESFADKTEVSVVADAYEAMWKPGEVPTTKEEFLTKRGGLEKQIETTAAVIAKAAEGKADKLSTAVRDEIAKAGPVTTKLEQLKELLKIDPDLDSYDLRWRVSELVGLMSQYAQIEAIVEDVAKSARPRAEMVWPSNLANATFDRAKGAFVPESLTWGKDHDPVR